MQYWLWWGDETGIELVEEILDSSLPKWQKKQLNPVIHLEACKHGEYSLLLFLPLHTSGHTSVRQEHLKNCFYIAQALMLYFHEANEPWKKRKTVTNELRYRTKTSTEFGFGWLHHSHEVSDWQHHNLKLSLWYKLLHPILGKYFSHNQQGLLLDLKNSDSVAFGFWLLTGYAKMIFLLLIAFNIYLWSFWRNFREWEPI